MDAGYVEELLQKHDQDLYRGNGRPGLTARVLVCEEKIDRVDRNINRMVKLVFTLVATVAADIIMHFFR